MPLAHGPSSECLQGDNTSIYNRWQLVCAILHSLALFGAQLACTSLLQTYGLVRPQERVARSMGAKITALAIANVVWRYVVPFKCCALPLVRVHSTRHEPANFLPKLVPSVIHAECAV